MKVKELLIPKSKIIFYFKYSVFSQFYSTNILAGFEPPLIFCVLWALYFYSGVTKHIFKVYFTPYIKHRIDGIIIVIN